MPSNVFVYGTLMAPQIIAAVIGREPASEPAVLAGYRRSCLEGELYPGIRPDPQARVQGLLYRHLQDQELHSLDRFEGDLYRRSAVTIDLQDRPSLQAEAYIVRPQHRHRLTDDPWDYAAFEQRFLERFVTQYRGFAR